MADYATPVPSATGTFKLRDPLKNVLTDGVIYKCDSVQTFGNVISTGKDPYDTYYVPLGLTDEPSKEAYLEHSRNGAHIVTLTDSGGRKFHIPSPYFESFPDVNGIAYTSLLMGLKLGALPDYMDLQQLKDKVADLVLSLIGVNPDPYIVKASPTTMIDPDAHRSIEEARQNKITDTTTDHSKIVQLTATIEILNEQVRVLEKYIVDNNL